MTEPTYLQLTPNFRVFRCDDRNLELEQFRTVVARRGKHVEEQKRETDRWVSCGYFSNLEQATSAALRVAEKDLTERERMDLGVLVSELTGLTKEMVEAVKSSGIKLTDFVKMPDARGRKAGEVKVAKVTDSAPTTKPTKKRGRGRPKKVKS